MERRDIFKLLGLGAGMATVAAHDTIAAAMSPTPTRDLMIRDCTVDGHLRVQGDVARVSIIGCYIRNGHILV